MTDPELPKLPPFHWLSIPLQPEEKDLAIAKYRLDAAVAKAEASAAQVKLRVSLMLQTLCEDSPTNTTRTAPKSGVKPAKR